MEMPQLTGIGRKMAWSSATVVVLALVACHASSTDLPLTGYAEADLVLIAPTGAGVLTTISVKKGDVVRAGQTLFTLDRDAETAAQAAAAARRDVAQSQLRDLSKGKRELEVRAIEEQLIQARAVLRASTAAWQRQHQLVRDGFVSATRQDELVAARDRDAARVRELQAQRALAQEAARQDALAAAAATERAAQADVALSDYRQTQRRRVAPVDAVVFDVNYRVGEVVNANAPVVSLLPPKAVKLRFFVPETSLSRVAVGQQVSLACTGCPQGLTAKVRWVSPQAEYTPPVIYSAGSRDKLVYMVEAEPSESAALKPGQPVDVRLADARMSP